MGKRFRYYFASSGDSDTWENLGPSKYMAADRVKAMLLDELERVGDGERLQIRMATQTLDEDDAPFVQEP